MKIRDLRLWTFGRIPRSPEGRPVVYAQRTVTFTQQRRGKARQFHVPGQPGSRREARQDGTREHVDDPANQRTVPEVLRLSRQFDQRSKPFLLSVQPKNLPGKRVGTFRPSLKDEFGHVHVRGAHGSTRLAIQTRFNHPLGIQVAVIRSRDDFKPSTRTHVFRLKHVVHRADRIAFGAGGTGLA